MPKIKVDLTELQIIALWELSERWECDIQDALTACLEIGLEDYGCPVEPEPDEIEI